MGGLSSYTQCAQFAPNWVLFAEKWYRDGSQNHAFRGIEMVEILNYTLSIPVRIFLKKPPPRRRCSTPLKNIPSITKMVHMDDDKNYLYFGTRLRSDFFFV